MYFSIKHNKFIQELSVYTVSSYINKAIPFLMLPILTKFLNTDEYGEVSMFLALMNLLIAVFGLSIEGALMRKYYDNNKQFPIVIFNYVLLLMSSFIICAILVYLFSSELVEYCGVSRKYLAAAVLCSFFTVICYCVNSIHQADGKAVYYALFTNGWTLLNTLLSILLVVYFGMGAAGRIYGIAISTILIGLLGVFLLFKKGWQPNVSLDVISEELKVFGIPMLPMNLRGTILSFTDKLFIANIINLSAAGVYTVGSQLAMVIDVFVRSIALAFTPWVYSKLKEGDNASFKKILKLATTLVVLIIVVSIIWIVVANVAFPLLVSENYSDALDYLIWLVASNGVMGVQLLFVNFIYFSKKTKIYSIVSTCSIALNILLNYMFISSQGAIGAAKATLLVYSITLLMTFVIIFNQYSNQFRQVRINRP